MTTMMEPPPAAIAKWRALVDDKVAGRPVDDVAAYVAAQMVKRDPADLDKDAALVRQRQVLFAEAARADEAREHLRDINTRQIALNQKRFAQDREDALTQHALNVDYDQWESVRVLARDALDRIRRNAQRLYPERQESIDAASAKLSAARTTVARLKQEAADHDIRAANIEMDAAAGFGLDATKRKLIKSHRADAERLRKESADVERGIPDLQRQLDDANAKLLEP